MADDLVEISKLLSLVLRHKPAAIGLTLDPNGWAYLDDLVRQANTHGHSLTRDLIERVVASSDKQRFAFDDSRSRIRANQGHSIAVELGLERQHPPEVLFHGTAVRFIDAIRARGLSRGKRHHVHLSADAVTANLVGQRHGSPVVLTVRAHEMALSGYQFFRSANGVWLVEEVPASFIVFPAGVRSP